MVQTCLGDLGGLQFQLHKSRLGAFSGYSRCEAINALVLMWLSHFVKFTLPVAIIPIIIHTITPKWRTSDHALY
ncbi:MAG: hypothetical protein ACK5EU_09760 [Pseudanabaena sp.]